MEKNFNALTWIKGSEQKIKPSLMNTANGAGNILQTYLIEGWRGEGLLSKTAISLQETLSTLHDEAKEQFYSRYESFNRSLKISIYDEFLKYLESNSINSVNIEDYLNFWTYLKDPNSKYRLQIDTFINDFTLQVVTIYYLKLRFISALAKERGQHLTNADLVNPNHFISQTFQRGSAQQISTEAFETNLYTTWFRPSACILPELRRLARNLNLLTLTETAKILSAYSEKSYGETSPYSHSLSHKTFGKFINLLLVCYPEWSEQNNGDMPPKIPFSALSGADEEKHRPVTSKFTGDHLNSMALAHWLAQEENCKIKWDQLLVSEFFSEGFYEGTFLRIVYELQFLYSMVFISKNQEVEATEFITNILRKKDQELCAGQKNNNQFALFEEIKPSKKYQRIVLNLNYFPSNNAHYYLINQINKQAADLVPGGWLFVLSSQNLFVPSQADRVQSMLNTLNLEGIMNLDSLKGKGELSPFIYILKKKDNNTINDSNLYLESGVVKIKKEQPCLNFRFQGELGGFNQFDAIFEELNSFLYKKSGPLPPILHRDLNHNLKFDFYQDAVKDGQLIHSTSDDLSQITHPSFFNKLVNSSVRLSDFFQLESINTEDFQRFREEAHRRKLPAYQYSLFLIVDNRDPNQISLEVAPLEVFEAKHQELGSALCYYFGLHPKRENINVNYFKEYFLSKLGQQIIQRSLLGLPAKLKSNLSNLLIPAFLAEPVQIPTSIRSGLFAIDLSEEEILKSMPKNLEMDYNQIENILLGLKNKYPCHLLELLSNFKYTLKNCINLVADENKINFYNPIVKSALGKIPKHPIYPENPNYNLKFNFKSKDDFERPLSHTRGHKLDIEGQVLNGLNLFNGEDNLLSIYSSEEAIIFLKFILQNAVNVSIAQIIQNLYLPSCDDIKGVFTKYFSLNDVLMKLEKRVDDQIQDIFMKNLKK